MAEMDHSVLEMLHFDAKHLYNDKIGHIYQVTLVEYSRVAFAGIAKSWNLDFGYSGGGGADSAHLSVDM